MNHSSFIFIFCLFFTCACQKSATEQRQKTSHPNMDSLLSKIIQVHDVGMEHMEEVILLKQRLDSLLQQHPDSLGKQIKQSMTLKHKDMMDWMHRFSKDMLKLSKGDKQRYQQEMIRIDSAFKSLIQKTHKYLQKQHQTQ